MKIQTASIDSFLDVTPDSCLKTNVPNVSNQNINQVLFIRIIICLDSRKAYYEEVYANRIINNINKSFTYYHIFLL